jgi:hypothetical protein
MGQHVPEMATVPQPDPMVAALLVAAPGGSSGGEPIASTMEAATNEATAEKEATDQSGVKKAADDAAVAKKPTKKVSRKSAEGSVGTGSSPTSVVGAKRAATPSGSTPPQKWFSGTLRSWYGV